MLESTLEKDGCDAAMKRRLIADPFTLKVYLNWALNDPTLEREMDAFARGSRGTPFASDDDLEEDVDDFLAEHGWTGARR